jgi:hypothetical protein
MQECSKYATNISAKSSHIYRSTRTPVSAYLRSPRCVEEGFADYFLSVFWSCIFEEPLHCESIDGLASSTGSRYKGLLGGIDGC